MSELKIIKTVIHELVKTQHKPIENSVLREKTLDVNLEPVQKLVDGVVSLYGKKNNTAQYGNFRTDEGRGDFPNDFEKYALLSTPTDKVFLQLSLIAMKALYQTAENMGAASGGYLLFADYLNKNGRFFLVAMIKQKEGLTLSKKLEPEELTQLDLSRLYQAARISFGKLSAYNAAQDPEKDELNYLSFVSPSSTKSTAGYFVTALGCVPGTASARATDTIIRESTTFFRNHSELKQHRLDFKKDLLDYLNKKVEKQESVKLSEVERLARKYIPASYPGQSDEIANDLISHLNDENNAVPVEFSANKTVLNRHRQIRYKHDNWELSFERVALGETENAQIHYDREQNRLILNPGYCI